MTDEKSPESLLLRRWSDGDDEAMEALTPLVYDELQKIAKSAFRREYGAHTLQATAVVHEAYLQLINASVDWQGKAHFYALAARMMRRILVNHAEARSAKKRGGEAVKVTYCEDAVAGRESSEDIVDLDRALEALAAEDERKARVLELHYFSGMTYKEAGHVLRISEATAKRELRFGKAWLRKYLEDSRSAED